MHCARCGAQTAASPCTSCGASPYLDGRYKLEERVGRRAGTTTWRATDIVSRQVVAVREFPINGQLTDEVKARLEATFTKLSMVAHPSFPRHVAGFVAGDAVMPEWFVVRAWVDGRPLAESLAEGGLSEAEVMSLLEAVLPALRALHAVGLAHGAIDLEQVLRRDDGPPTLLDPTLFEEILLAAGVGDEPPPSAFAAPEELRGAAGPASDLYRIGLVAACLLSGLRPGDLRGADGRFDLSHRVEASPALVALLSELTQMDPGRRPVSAAVAMEALAAVKSNPASVAGITAFDEYTPLPTPPPAPSRSPEPASPRRATTPLPGVTVARSETAGRGEPSAVAPGRLPIATPGPPPPPPRRSSNLVVGLGCAGALLVALGGGAAVAVAFGLGWIGGTTTAPPPPAPAAQVEPAPPPPPPPPPPPAPTAASPPSPADASTPSPADDGTMVALDGPRDPANGLLRIRCERRALISINGRAVDLTPLDLELAPGAYTVTAVIPTIEDWEEEKQVQLDASEVEEVRFEL